MRWPSHCSRVTPLSLIVRRNLQCYILDDRWMIIRNDVVYNSGNLSSDIFTYTRYVYIYAWTFIEVSGFSHRSISRLLHDSNSFLKVHSLSSVSYRRRRSAISRARAHIAFPASLWWSSRSWIPLIHIPFSTIYKEARSEHRFFFFFFFSYFFVEQLARTSPFSRINKL